MAVNKVMSWGSEFFLLSTGNVADGALSLVHVMDPGIRALDVNMKLFGPAYPVECSGGNNLAIIQAVSCAPAGAVLVVNVHGHLQAGHVGDMLAKAAQIRGIAGIVIDGACRDVDEVVRMRFPLFARGSNPHGTLKLKNGKINQPTECGGVMINPGDLIFADASGVVAFAQSDAEAILKKAKEIAIREFEIVRKLRQGKAIIDVLGLDKI